MAYKIVWLCVLQLHKCIPVRFILFSVSNTQVYSWMRKAVLMCVILIGMCKDKCIDK